MADPKAQSGTGLSSDVINNVIQNLPAYMNTVNAQLAPQARSELATQQEIAPQYQELLTSLYEKFAPRLATAGAGADRISREATARTDADILKGAGGDTVRNLSDLDRSVNPEYYKTREAGAAKLGELLGSINLSDANPEAERLVSQENARSGNLTTPSSTRTVANALSFGNEQQKRRDALGQAINTASGFLAPASGTFNTANIALGKGPTNTGLTNFAGVKDTQNQAVGAASGIMGTSAGLVGQQQDINSQRRDVLDRINETSPDISV